MFWLAQLKQLQEHSLFWAHAGAFTQCCPGSKTACSILSVNASHSATDHLLPGFTGGTYPKDTVHIGPSAALLGRHNVRGNRNGEKER